MVCGHCVAICPREAIDNKRTPRSNQISTKDFQKLSSEEAKNFLHSRRLIRSYKETSVSREKSIDLVNIANFASIGSDLQEISYIIVDDKNLLNKAIKITIEELASNSFIMIRSNHYIQSYHNKGIDTVLRGATLSYFSNC
ncbi:nitroreductase family protein [Clostridium botulinum]|uniref:nitroreductase family protein n=1 Tax=Clostridium botulinum TaxID=1491 RepID=UPI00310146DD